MRLLPLPGVFRPHIDSWMLADRLRHEQLGPGTSVLDLCTGSGVLAVLAAKCGAAKVVAVDVSRGAVVATRLNARLNAAKVQVVRGDLFSPLRSQHFDLIVSNPPYIPSDRVPSHGAPRAWEGGPRGRAFIDRICAQAGQHLNPRGALLLVHSSVCGERETVEALCERGLTATVVARHRGSLGPRMRARAEWLRAEGLLEEGDREEIVIFRARRDSSARARGRAAMTATPAKGGGHGLCD